jgi:hypothetical protein
MQIITQFPVYGTLAITQKEVAPDVFTMFDNDYDNNTNPDKCHSQLIEITLNETSMTALVNWSWKAPEQYWNTY